MERKSTKTAALDLGTCDKFRAIFKRLIDDSDKSQKQIEEAVGFSHSTMSRLLNGETPPTVLNLLILCDYFKVSPNELLGYQVASVAEFGEAGLRVAEMIDDVDWEFQNACAQVFKATCATMKDEATQFRIRHKIPKQERPPEIRYVVIEQ